MPHLPWRMPGAALCEKRPADPGQTGTGFPVQSRADVRERIDHAGNDVSPVPADVSVEADREKR